MISENQKNKIIQIVSVFETGKKDGDYAAITVMRDGHHGTRQVTYGKHQTTEQGNLKELLEMYIENEGIFAENIEKFAEKIGRESLASNAEFKELLVKAANEDQIMRDTQDEFFEKDYYLPAYGFFSNNKFTLALSMLVIYDSFVHSGSIRSNLRQKFSEVPPAKGGDEKTWITQYVDVRHNWLANHENKLLRNTTYRTKCFKEQISNNNWDLDQPINAHGIIIS